MKNINFSVGDNVVYPTHGVGRVVSIDSKEMFGQTQTFYTIQIIESGMKIMIPRNDVEYIGLRSIISSEEADKVIGMLKQKDISIDNRTWNRRYHEYMEKIKTGTIYEIVETVKMLTLIKTNRDLSFGERIMLHTARLRLVDELSIASGKEKVEISNEISNIFRKGE